MMIEYQNIFTRVQVHGPLDLGPPMKPGNWPREKGATTNWLLGVIGDDKILFLLLLNVVLLVGGEMSPPRM